MPINGCVRKLSIEFKQPVNNRFLLRIINKYYGPFETTDGVANFGFEDFDFINCNGRQNRDLSNEKNKKVLNFSRIESPSLILLDNTTEINNINCYKYVTYYLDSLTPKYSD